MALFPPSSRIERPKRLATTHPTSWPILVDPVALIRDWTGGNFRVQLMDLASGQVQSLTTSSDDESPSFAPNGRLIIYATRAQGRDVLMTTTIDGRIKARLNAPQADVREPIWGPYAR